jgi:hypothetical protein
MEFPVVNNAVDDGPCVKSGHHDESTLRVQSDELRQGEIDSTLLGPWEEFGERFLNDAKISSSTTSSTMPREDVMHVGVFEVCRNCRCSDDAITFLGRESNLGVLIPVESDVHFDPLLKRFLSLLISRGSMKRDVSDSGVTLTRE